MISPITSSSPPRELAVVGEHRDDPQQLLLKDAEGNYYAYDLLSGDPELVEPDDEAWEVEPVPNEELFA